MSPSETISERLVQQEAGTAPEKPSPEGQKRPERQPMPAGQKRPKKKQGGRLHEVVFSEEDLERFWRFVDASTPEKCWNWNGMKFWDGYGIFPYKNRQFRAHRTSFKISFGNFDSKLFVCHKCDNPACVNPSHLFLGTNKDNVQDCLRKDRHLRGSEAHMAKLNSEKVKEAIRLHKEERVQQKEIAKMFGVSRATICNIMKGKIWSKTILLGERKNGAV